jgi:hypothetical protein
MNKLLPRIRVRRVPLYLALRGLLPFTTYTKPDYETN